MRGSSVQFSSVQSLSRVWLFATPWIAAHRASLSITIFRSSLRFTSMSNHIRNIFINCILKNPIFFPHRNKNLNDSCQWLEELKEWEAALWAQSFSFTRWKDSGDWVVQQVQFSSVTQSCPTPLDPMNHSTPGLPVHHHLPEFTQTHVRVHGAIQPSHPRSSSSPPAPNPSQHQSLFQWITSSHEVAKVLEFQL